MELNDPRLKRSIFKKPDVGQWQLAHFAKTLIEASNDYRQDQIQEEELYLACNYHNHIRGPDDAGNIEGRRGVLNNLIRISYSQFPFQMQNHKADIPRALILFEELAAQAIDEFDVDSAFRKLTGLSIREFILHGFAIWAICGNGEIPPVKESTDPRTERLLPLEKQQKFRDIITADYMQFRECQAKKPIKKGLEKQQFNCLHTYPLIRTQKSRKLVCPVPLLLIRRVTRGVYYQLQDAYSRGGRRNEFTQFFGKRLFEPYVGMHLRALATTAELIPEQDIGSEKTCDWILVEGESLTLIECKALGLTFKSKALAETDDVADDLSKRIVKAVKACERTRQAIQEGLVGLAHLKGKTTRNLIVFYDDIFLFNSPLYRELIESELQANGLGAVPFQVCAIRELEYAVPLLQNSGLGNFLDQKLADRDHATWDIGTLLGRLIEDGALKTNGPNKILAEKLDSLFAELTAQPNHLASSDARLGESS